MIRTQIQFEQTTYFSLKEMARARSVSISEIVRQSVEKNLEESRLDTARASALKAVGAYRSGLHDLARNHDKYLADDW